VVEGSVLGVAGAYIIVVVVEEEEYEIIMSADHLRLDPTRFCAWIDVGSETVGLLWSTVG
jgi:hypothetical protein